MRNSTTSSAGHSSWVNRDVTKQEDGLEGTRRSPESQQLIGEGKAIGKTEIGERRAQTVKNAGGKGKQPKRER